MAGKRKIEIYSAGCSICQDAIDQVRAAACNSCDIEIQDMTLPEVQRGAAELGIRSLPAVVIDGMLADCCSGGGVDTEVLRKAGLGVPLA